MGWEIVPKRPRSPNHSVPGVTISRFGLTFNRGATEQWVKSAVYAEVLVDKQARKLAIQFSPKPSLHGYKITQTGTRGPQRKLCCNHLLEFLGFPDTIRLTGTLDEQECRVEMDLPEQTRSGEEVSG